MWIRRRRRARARASCTRTSITWSSPTCEWRATLQAAKYHPAIAMLTAFPIADEDWQSMGADKMLVKPMHTRILLQQIEKLLASHEAKLSIWSTPAPKPTVAEPVGKPPAAKTKAAGKAPAKRVASKTAAKKAPRADVKKAAKAKKAGAKAAKKK